MVLENEKVRSEKLYCVGYLKTLGKYILSQTVPASAWYNRYYEITKESQNPIFQGFWTLNYHAEGGNP
jgi:hypothetical protein